MIIFNVDMDNTVIYSYKHDIGDKKKCAEIYQGREISFITDKTQELLNRIAKKILVVPTTTRTKEQYERIDLGIGNIPYALVCNGGILLVDGVEDDEWYKESLSLISPSSGQLKLALELLEVDENRSFEVRNIEDLFVFTKSDEPDKTMKRLTEKLDTSLVDVMNNGVKIYVVPKALSKGNAVMRLKKRLAADNLFAAGDSEFDISMLQCADISIAPESLEFEKVVDNHVIKVKKSELFSEKVMEHVEMQAGLLD